MKKGASPSTEAGACVHDCFQQTDHAGKVNLDAGDSSVGVGNRQS